MQHGKLREIWITLDNCIEICVNTRNETTQEKLMKRTTHGNSGKFIAEPLYQVRDIQRHLKVEPNGCILTPAPPPFGNLRNGIWYIQIRELTPTGRRRIMAVVEKLWNHYYPFSFIRHGKAGRGLKRICKTKGCLNYRHYDIINSVKKTFGETYMARQEIINLMTAALTQDETVTFGDEASAESFRMHIYRLKRKWKKENSPYHTLFEDVVIKKGKLHPNILDFTSNGRAYEDALSRFRTAPAGSVEEPMSVEERELLDDAILGRERGAETLESLGYWTKEIIGKKEGVVPLTYEIC